MADENTVRSYRANDPYGDDAIPSGERDYAGGHDPLAELARLIGQNDPFADIGRGTPHASEGRDPSHFAVGAATDRRRSPAPLYVAPMQPGYQDDTQPSLQPPPFPPSTMPRHDRIAASTAGLSADPYADPHDQVAVQDGPYGDADQFEPADAGESYAAAAPEEDPYYEDVAPIAPQDEEMYDDPPSARQRGGLLTVVTLVGCAMLGTAGAYAYRTYTVRAAPANPPIIVADKTPVKVVPPTETQSSKAIQDRVASQGGNEHVVSHEEQPMTLPPAGTPVAPRVVLPAPVAPMPNTSAAFPPPPAAAAVPPASAAATPSTGAVAPTPTSRSAAGGEPKRVRTVTIRPDGTDLNGNPVRGGGAADSSPAPRAASAQSHGEPLSLTPGSESPAPARRAAAPRLASAPSAVASGGYMVQVSSQRSEAEAHASYRAMQAKYRGVLGGHEGTVRRADLGARGTFYRAMVGPFASAGEAGQLCSQLKAAGGQCIIQRN